MGNILAFCPAEILYFHWKCHTNKLIGDVYLEIIKTEKLFISLSPLLFLFNVGSNGSNQKSKCIFPPNNKEIEISLLLHWCIKNIPRQNHPAFQNFLLTIHWKERLPRNSPSTEEFLLALCLLTVSEQCRCKLEDSWSDSSEISPLLHV